MHDPWTWAKERLGGFWHGGDWNPDQWLDRPEVIEEDFRLFRLAGVNVVSIGIFSWSRLEPEEGRYDFGWLDDIMNRLDRAGMKAVLATPSASKPAWMLRKYPEVLRCSADRSRDLHGQRHNHCYTSPVYRAKAAAMARALAERYGVHPALLAWHVSNEYGGECHCPLCQDAFRSWLRGRYGSLDDLNRAWWNDFWGHRYSDWAEVESPSDRGENSNPSLNLDWRRFVDHQSLDFFLTESAPLRKLTPHVPVTVNMMGTYPGLNYRNWGEYIDVVSWDSYPRWHNAERDDFDEASAVAFRHDLMRSIKRGKPWLLMESTPSQVNWQPINRLKAPGMHLLSSVQALAHGSDSVMYFQWRKCRGGFEQHHGAVVDHGGASNTRVFHEVADVGRFLKENEDMAGSVYKAEAAVIYDWECRWAIDFFSGYGRPERDYERACEEFHRAFWRRSIACDVPAQDDDLSCYKIVAAPWLYLLKEKTAERLSAFVEDGGILLLTFFSGMVNENGLCFEGGFPGPLRRLAGLWAEELDPLWKGQRNRLVPAVGTESWLSGEYAVDSFCGLIRPESAETLATYGEDWYSGRPALTRNAFGKGCVYYLAARAEKRLIDDLVGHAAEEAKVEAVLPGSIPKGINAQLRLGEKYEYVVSMNFSRTSLAGLPPYGVRIERRDRKK
jgi:beta-galactosidase